MIQIGVMSGKGGVGKSSISILLSTVLSERGKTLLLDFDLCGPSIARGLNVKEQVHKGEKGLVPVPVSDGLYVLSMALLMKENDSVIWRGPKKLSVLSMFYESIDDFDYVVIDMPPGISEEHGFMIGKDINTLIITTPQNVSLSDSSKAINFCMTNDIPIIGLVENMSGYHCECCGTISNVFGSKGGERLADEYEIPFICRLEIDSSFGEMLDDGEFIKKYSSLGFYERFKESILNLEVFKRVY